MATVPTKVKDRLASATKRFQPVVASAKSRDVNESDTVTIVTDILADLFGYDKYSEITSEYVIRSTYVDLAIKLDGKPRVLIEVKAIGLELKDAYIKQAVDYAANQGIDWVVLTNAVRWQVYQVGFTKPISQELVIEFDFLGLNPKLADHIESLYLLSKEGISRSILDDYQAQRQALSRYFIGAMVLSDSVLSVIRRELRRLSPDVRIDTEQIKAVLKQDVLKRDVVEGDKAEDAKRKITRAAKGSLRRAAKATSEDEVVDQIDEPVGNAEPVEPEPIDAGPPTPAPQSSGA